LTTRILELEKYCHDGNANCTLLKYFLFGNPPASVAVLVGLCITPLFGWRGGRCTPKSTPNNVGCEPLLRIIR